MDINTSVAIMMSLRQLPRNTDHFALRSQKGHLFSRTSYVLLLCTKIIVLRGRPDSARSVAGVCVAVCTETIVQADAVNQLHVILVNKVKTVSMSVSW